MQRAMSWRTPLPMRYIHASRYVACALPAADACSSSRMACATSAGMRRPVSSSWPRRASAGGWRLSTALRSRARPLGTSARTVSPSSQTCASASSAAGSPACAAASQSCFALAWLRVAKMPCHIRLPSAYAACAGVSSGDAGSRAPARCFMRCSSQATQASPWSCGLRSTKTMPSCNWLDVAVRRTPRESLNAHAIWPSSPGTTCTTRPG